MMIDLDDGSGKKGGGHGSQPSFSPQSVARPFPDSRQVVKKVIHTRTEVSVYPDGSVYHRVLSSWIEGAVYKPRRKVKKVVVEKDVAVGGVEEW